MVFEEAETRSSICEGFLDFIEGSSLTSPLNRQSIYSFSTHFGGSSVVIGVSRDIW